MGDVFDRPALKWSTQFDILPTSATPPLRGDKIILPPSALEQLLSAATVSVDSATHPQTATFDPFNPHSYAAEHQARERLVERQQQLPHPLTFRLVNPKNGKMVFAGIREFSAPNSTIGLSAFLRESLGVGGDVDAVATSRDVRDSPHSDSLDTATASQNLRLTVHFHELSKGTYVRLRPLEAGYDPEDWKALLEQYLRDTFTTLTNKELIIIPAGKETFRFLVDGLQPSEDAVSLVDTDLEVDIEPLNEEQARETLQRRARKLQKAHETKDGSSLGGIVQIGSSETGQVLPGEYVDYTLEKWDPTADLDVELTVASEGDDVDLFVSPFGRKHRSKPREDEYVLGDLSSRATKRLEIRQMSIVSPDAEKLLISLRGYALSDEKASVSSPIQFSLRIRDSFDKTPDHGEVVQAMPRDDEERCKNCHQLVPKRTMFLHENFCLRNNVLCSQCQNVFQKSSPEWQNHWHCPHDASHGNSPSSHTKHERLLHTSVICSTCAYAAANVPDLAYHRTTRCPGRLILCQFCHLQVAQCGPDDPSPTSAEVILSGLSPHEVSDGARTTECHLCSKIVRLRDMHTHLKHHDLQRLSRPKPRICRNINCGRVIDTVSATAEVKQQPSQNELGLCDKCYGPLYVSMYDPDGKALRRRVERKYMTQLLTGCGQAWCRNEFCKSGRRNLRILGEDQSLMSKEATQMIKPMLEHLNSGSFPMQLCTDEASQKRRILAEMVAAEGRDTLDNGKGGSQGNPDSGSGYELGWCIAALEVESGDLDRSRAWLKGFAPTRAETSAL